MLDVKDKPIRPSRIRRSIILLIITGGSGSVWFTFCSNGQIMNVLVQNHLGASDRTLGILGGFLSFIGIFNLGAILLYYRAKRIKRVFVPVTLLSKTSAFFISAAAFYVHCGGSREIALMVIVVSTVLFSSVANNLTGPLWWTWISHLIPDKKRASFFGIRTSVSQASSILMFFAATFCLDRFSINLFFVYGLFYFMAGIAGMSDIIIHCFVPEPKHTRSGTLTIGSFFAPFRDGKFMKFALIIGLTNASIGISVPFHGPYITNPGTIGAANLWLGIMFVLSQVSWIIMAPFWGTMIDRLGKKPMILLGLAAPFAYVGFIFLSPDNCSLILPLIAVFSGLLTPAYGIGVSQLMLSLPPEENRISYIGWFHALIGALGAAGPIAGGYIMELTWGNLSMTISISLALVSLSFLLCLTIQVDESVPFSRIALLMMTPSTFRTYSQIPILSGTSKPGKVEKALKSINQKTGSLVMDEIINRLDDPEENVRREAVSALGRVATAEARDKLMNLLTSSESLLKAEAAQALGDLKDPRATPVLVSSLYGESEQVRKEAAAALGKIPGTESVEALKTLLKEDGSESVKVAGARSIASLGEIEAVEEILQLWMKTENEVLKKQLIISMGNLIGKPGEIYKLLTGTAEKQETAISQLFADTKSALRKTGAGGSAFVRFFLDETFPSLEMEFYNGEFNSCFDRLLGFIGKVQTGESGVKIDREGKERRIDFQKTVEYYSCLGTNLVENLRIYRNQNRVLKAPEILLLVYFVKNFCLRKSRSR